jgi:purine-binding chemotaxis protein CheW
MMQSDTPEHVCCTVNGRHVAVAMSVVREIITAAPLMPMPLMPPWVMGLMHLRGTPLAILNLDQCLKAEHTQTALPCAAPMSRHACILVVSTQLEFSPDPASDNMSTQPIGLWVDRVHDIISARPDQVLNTPSLGNDVDAALIDTTLLWRQQPIASINMRQLLSPQRLGSRIAQHVQQTIGLRLQPAD